MTVSYIHYHHIIIKRIVVKLDISIEGISSQEVHIQAKLIITTTWRVKTLNRQSQLLLIPRKA